jgi:hypothetical protein
LDWRLGGPRAGLDNVERRKISCSYLESNPGSPACSPLLYRVSYPGSENQNIFKQNIFVSLLLVRNMVSMRVKHELEVYENIVLEIEEMKK